MPCSTPTEGRPCDADRSQKDILDAALAEFAEHGLGGAHMDRIAERAAVDKQVIDSCLEHEESPGFLFDSYGYGPAHPENTVLAGARFRFAAPSPAGPYTAAPASTVRRTRRTLKALTTSTPCRHASASHTPRQAWWSIKVPMSSGTTAWPMSSPP